MPKFTSASTALGTTIETGEITDGAVTTAKIADANVTTAKIAADAVTAEKLDPLLRIIVGLR